MRLAIARRAGTAPAHLSTTSPSALAMLPQYHATPLQPLQHAHPQLMSGGAFSPMLWLDEQQQQQLAQV